MIERELRFVTTDVFTPEQRSAVMRRVRGRDTGPELAVRRILRAAGIGYRLGGAGLPGRPDLVMKGRRAVVFVHGCFWHGHDCARGSRKPKANAGYWTAKIDRNRARDATAVTADTAPEDIAACTEAGMTYFVPKPITPPMLLGAITHVMTMAQADEAEVETAAA